VHATIRAICTWVQTRVKNTYGKSFRREDGPRITNGTSKISFSLANHPNLIFNLLSHTQGEKLVWWRQLFLIQHRNKQSMTVNNNSRWRQENYKPIGLRYTTYSYLEYSSSGKNRQKKKTVWINTIQCHIVKLYTPTDCFFGDFANWALSHVPFLLLVLNIL